MANFQEYSNLDYKIFEKLGLFRFWKKTPNFMESKKIQFFFSIIFYTTFSVMIAKEFSGGGGVESADHTLSGLRL